MLRALVQAIAKMDDIKVGNNRKVLASLPVWSQYGTDSYLRAASALACQYEGMLQPWIKDLDRFIDPDVVWKYRHTLEALGCSLMSVQSAWKYVESNLPTVLKPDQIPEYLRCVDCLSRKGCKPTSRIAPNGYGALCSPSTLFDHEDPIFLAAFGESDRVRFLHPKFRNDRDFWIDIGLRSRSKKRVLDASDFLECVSQIVARLSSSSNRSEIYPNAETITGFLRYSQPGLADWSLATWQTIAQAEMYQADGDVSSEPLYRRAKMVSLASDSTPRCINNAAPCKYKRIVWSQRPFLKYPPDAAPYSKFLNGGKPKAQLVYHHLQFLVRMRNDIDDLDLAEYLKDLQATYAYLQELRIATAAIPDIREAKVWLNLHTTELESIKASQFDSSLKSAKQLCFNAPLDTHLMERAKNFLVPYEALLKVLGCQSMVQPPKVSITSDRNKQRPIDCIWSALRDMRMQGQLVDVVFEAEGEQVAANQIIMAASSEYCRAQFMGEWGSILGPKPTIQIKDLSSKTLNYIVDFAYTGEVNWPRLQDREDIIEVADALDELLDLLRGADMWLIDMLHDLTERYLLDNSETFIRPDNVDSVKELADGARASQLKTHCDEFIRVNARFVQDCRDMK